MHRRVKWAVAIAVGASAMGATAVAQTPDDDYDAASNVRVRATLNGLQEVPSISTRARGTFEARIDGRTIRWVETFSGLEGGAVQQSHIHFARRHVSGGISVWLCGNVANTPAGVQRCPQSGTISWTIRGTDVV